MLFGQRPLKDRLMLRDTVPKQTKDAKERLSRKVNEWLRARRVAIRRVALHGATTR